MLKQADVVLELQGQGSFSTAALPTEVRACATLHTVALICAVDPRCIMNIQTAPPPPYRSPLRATVLFRNLHVTPTWPTRVVLVDV
jgi:hypothetical protein